MLVIDRLRPQATAFHPVAAPLSQLCRLEVEAEIAPPSSADLSPVEDWPYRIPGGWLRQADPALDEDVSPPTGKLCALPDLPEMCAKPQATAPPAVLQTHSPDDGPFHRCIRTRRKTTDSSAPSTSNAGQETARRPLRYCPDPPSGPACLRYAYQTWLLFEPPQP